MELFESIISQQIVQRLGWTLIHFLWQGATVAILLAVMLRLLKKSTANMRYLAAFIAMAVIVFLPIVTLKMIDVSVSAVDVEKSEAAGAVIVESSAVPAVEFVSTVIVEPTKSVEPVLPRISLHRRFVEAIELNLPYIVIGWFIGVFGLSIWYLGGWCQLQKLRSRNLQAVSQPLQNKLARLADVLGVTRMVQIAQSALVQVPTVIGHFKPVILLPAAALTGLTSQQIETILAHELAHIKRCDYLVNIAQTVIEILGFYHPAVWWISNKLRVERENCCDDLAVGISDDRLCYAKALATMEEVRSKSLAVAASGGSLLERICRLVGKDSVEKEKSSWLPSVIAIILLTAMLIPAALALNSKATLPNVETVEQVMKLAEEKARSLDHEYIGTEHILLVIAQKDGIASDILKNSGIDKDKLNTEIMKVVRKGLKPVTKKRLSTTPRAKQALDYAVKQAGDKKNLHTGHILLGLLQVEDCVAAQVLNNLGLSLEKAMEDTEPSENIEDRSKNTEEKTQFKATLSNGVTVELLGICEFENGKVQNCWRPDGTNLDKQIHIRYRNYPHKTFGFIFNTNQTAEITKCKATGLSDRLGVASVVDANNKLTELAKNGQQHVKLLRIDQTDLTDITLFVAPDWVKSIRYDGKYVQGYSDQKIRFFETYETAMGIKVIFSNGYKNYENNLLAILTEQAANDPRTQRNRKNIYGHFQRKPEYSNVWASDGQKQTSAFFEGVKLSDVKYFELSIRPRPDKAIFKNVSLKPNFKTDVQIEVEEAKATEAENASREQSEPKADVNYLKNRWVGSNLPNDRKGYALRFDGVNDFVRVPRSSSLEPSSEITIEMWALLEGSQSRNTRLLRKAGHMSSGYLLAIDQVGDGKIQFRADTGKRTIKAADGQRHNYCVGSWHHFAGVYSKTHVVLYIDGIEISKVYHGGQKLNHSPVDLYIGHGAPGGTSERGISICLMANMNFSLF